MRRHDFCSCCAGGLAVRANEFILPITAVGISCWLLTWWLAGTSGHAVTSRLPGQDGLPLASVKSSAAGARVVAGEPVAGEGKPSELAGKWPGFRGANRAAIVNDGVPLARAWPASGPVIQWSISLGEGYASATIGGGRVFVLDYDEQAAADTMRCLSLDDGREIWRNSYSVAVTRNHGMSRSVPAIVEDYIITMGPRCHVACWDAETGKCHWLLDLVRDHAATEPRWYSGQCPLIDEGRVILAPCGDALLIAVDYRTGEVIWESPNPRRWEMTHVSIMPMEFAGRRSYVYCGSGGVAAVAADDGTLLWDSTEWPTIFATCPSPLILPEGRVFLCSGYSRTIGSLLLQVQNVGNQLIAEPVYTLTPQQFNSEQHTPIFYGDHIYGVRKRGGGQLVCLDLGGKEIWNSGAERFGHGPYLIADGLIFVMDDDGWLTMAEATPTGYQQLGHHEVFADGHDAWGPMALADGRLIVRDMTRMACLDLTEKR